MSPDSIDDFGTAAAAYVHIPFCSAVCPYCDFAVVAGQDELTERYVDALCAEILGSAPWRPLDAIYLGGGTPTHIDPKLIGRVLGALGDVHGVGVDAEISIEANPEDFTSDKAQVVRELGFNRVSLGAQSFDRDVLLSLGRRHDSDDVEEAIRAARDAGFPSVSIDLIYGTPGETDDSWSATLDRAIAAGPDHISCYALTVERGTPLSRSVAGGAPAPDPDVQADRYETAEQRLGDAHLTRYEVSNWARDSHECRYNLTVWAQGEYEAYGNGAHGFREGARFRNLRRVDAYIEAVEAGEPPRAGEDHLSPWDMEIDRLFVGLRRGAGVRRGPGTDALVGSEQGRLLLEAGVIESVGDRLVVARPLLTDAVHRAVLGLAPQPNAEGVGKARITG